MTRLNNRTVSVDLYGNLVPRNTQVPRVFEFVLDGGGQIIPDLSPGKRDEIYSICLLPIHLWVY